MKLFPIEKKDKLLIACVIIIAAVSSLVMGMTQHGGGGMLCITIDGRIYGEYSISENQVITVNEKLGYNQVVIEHGRVYMSEADCPDKYCMDYKPIAKENETIICLPHKLVLQIVGDSDEEVPDVIVQ